MRSSSVLSSRRCGPSASSCRHGASPARVAAALLHRRPLRSGVLPLTTTNSMTTLAISGDDTGLITALSSAPPEAVAALGAVLVGLGAIVASALAGEKDSSSSSASSSSYRGASAPPPPPPPRRDAVAVFGASGKVGRQIVKALLASSSSSSSNRTVVAAVRSAERAREAFAGLGLDVDRAVADGSLSIVGGIDVTQPSTLSPNPELWKGVSQVAVSLGPVFGRLPEGGMGYFDGMTSEAVDARGVSALVEAMKTEMKASTGAQSKKPETTPLVPMGSAEDLSKNWDPLDDVIMGGKSSSVLSSIAAADGNNAVWKGELIFEGGGFCGTRTKKGALDVAFGPISSTSSSSAFTSLPRFDGVQLRVRSDRGQTFKLNLKTASQEGIPESTYQALVDTNADGEWTDVRLPWSSFVATKRARFDPSSPTLAQVARDGGSAATIKQIGLALSRFEFDGAPNLRCGGPGAFELEVDGSVGVKLFKESPALRRPACVLLTSAAIERNARIGDDAAKRAADVPIVRLNPGGALNWKYIGEAALRHSGISYAVVRATGLNDEEVLTKPAENDNADSSASTPAAPVIFPIEAGQGDTISGIISRAEVARVVAAALNPLSSGSSSSSASAAANANASPIGKTIEVRRGLPADAERLSGNGRDDAALALLWQRAVPDRQRHLFGFPPLPAPCPPPAPPAEEEVKKVLADPRVAAAAAAADNARGGRVRSEEEAAEAKSVVPSGDDGRARASSAGAKKDNADSADNDKRNDDENSPPPPPPEKKTAEPIPENVADAREWVRAWRARSLEKKLPVESRAQ